VTDPSHRYVSFRRPYGQKTAARTSELAARVGVLPQYLSWMGPRILKTPLRLALREKQLQEAERLLSLGVLSVDRGASSEALKDDLLTEG